MCIAAGTAAPACPARIPEEGSIMAKIIDCAKVNPESGCGHVIRADSEEELLRLAGEHAKTGHGMDPTPALVAAVKAHIQDV
jgi:predicted small metal-binding protein